MQLLLQRDDLARHLAQSLLVRLHHRLALLVGSHQIANQLLLEPDVERQVAHRRGDLLLLSLVIERERLRLGRRGRRLRAKLALVVLQLLALAVELPNVALERRDFFARRQGSADDGGGHLASGTLRGCRRHRRRRRAVVIGGRLEHLLRELLVAAEYLVICLEALRIRTAGRAGEV